jgi:GH15 family glucan-1,4-alpha-glucosidase
MYGIDGRRSLPEVELGHLRGHRDSRPVRIGNGAVQQRQLDVYGSMLQAAYIYARAGGTISPTNWDFLSGLADIVCDAWREPDQGIWEIRDEPRHFVHSKLLCWTALDRAIAVADARQLPCDRDRWQREREGLRHYLLDEAAAPGWFPQAVGSKAADASSLLVPAVGFLPPRHPLVLETIRRVREQLEIDGLLFRYKATDGLLGEEGCFLLCSFWLVDALIHARELDEAERLLERLIRLENDVGLYAEEALPDSGEMLGNFPQAFTHMALVTSAAHMSAARAGELPDPDEAYDFAEIAFMRLAR